MRGLTIAFFVALAGCQLSQQAETEDVAEGLCKCLDPGDAACVATISTDLGTAVSDACSQCVFDNERTCANMVVACPPLCISNPTPGGL